MTTHALPPCPSQEISDLILSLTLSVLEGASQIFNSLVLYLLGGFFRKLHFYAESYFLRSYGKTEKNTYYKLQTCVKLNCG